MGLDMYLEGHKYLCGNYNNPEDGFRLKGKILELGYWRKHPDLHGYIVNTFASGKDNCQDIELGLYSLENILQAIKDDKLPFTEGFFFGKSLPEDGQSSMTIIKNAINWLATEEDGTVRYVIYRASW